MFFNKEDGFDVLRESSMRDQTARSVREREEDWVRRESFALWCGTDSVPLASLSLKRGASEKEIIKEIRSIQRVYGRVDKEPVTRLDWQSDEEYEATKIRMANYNKKCQEFKNSKIDDLYFVFSDDCGLIDPIKNKNSKWECSYNTAWNVFANFVDDDPEFVAVWKKFSVGYKDFLEKVVSSQPIPPPPPLPVFTLDPYYKQEIDKLVLKIQDIPDADTAPYNLVVEQKKIQHDLRQWYIILASKKLQVEMNTNKPPYIQIDINNNSLSFSLCDYDDWDAHYNLFKKMGMKICEWDKRVEYFPPAYWDLSDDPDFAHSKQKVFTVFIKYYNSHVGGW